MPWAVSGNTEPRRGRTEPPRGARCCCFSNCRGPSWVKPLAAGFIEGVQFRVPVWGVGMSSEQERPVLPNSTPTGCQITSVIHGLSLRSEPFRGKTPSHYLAILEMADFCSNPFLGDLFPTEVARGKPPACKSPASRSRLPWACCSRRVVLRWDKGRRKAAAELHRCQQLSTAVSPPRG